MGEGEDMAKGIGASVVGSVVGNKAADKLHLGGAGHMVGGIGGGILGGQALGEAEKKAHEHEDKKD